jgi:hypothetical protein
VGTLTSAVILSLTLNPSRTFVAVSPIFVFVHRRGIAQERVRTNASTSCSDGEAMRKCRTRGWPTFVPFEGWGFPEAAILRFGHDLRSRADSPSPRLHIPIRFQRGNGTTSVVPLSCLTARLYRLRENHFLREHVELDQRRFSRVAAICESPARHPFFHALTSARIAPKVFHSFIFFL